MMLRNGKFLAGGEMEPGAKAIGASEKTEAQSAENAVRGDFIADPNPVTPSEDSCSMISGVSKASLDNKRRQAELEAEEEIFKREKSLILKRLELRKAQIDEEERELDEIVTPPIVEVNIPLATETKRTENWVNETHERESTQKQIADLLKSMTEAFSQLGNATQAPSSQNMEKFLARQATGKDLPTFSGDPEDWPGFITNFEKSTEVCGFSEEENLLRLQRCLKGKAREAVRSILHLPNQMKNIMQTLALSFGRPGSIVKSMIQKVKTIPNLRDDKIEMLIDFSNAVKNLVATMENLHCVGHLSNPQLLEDLVQKLPTNLKLQWGMMAASLKREEPSLVEFSYWLDEMALAVSYVSCSSPAVRDPVKIKQEQAKPYQKYPVFTTEQGSQQICRYCKANGHSLYTCENFLSESPESKSNWVREANLCYCCLKAGHQSRECRRKRKCGLDGCKLNHHRSLHGAAVGKPGTEVVGTTLAASSGHVVAHSSQTAPQVLFRLLPVKLQGPNGELQIHALFDEGSSVTLLDSTVAHQLGLNGHRDPLQLTWVNNSSQVEMDSQRVSVKIQGVNVNTCEYELQNVRTVKNLALPYHSMDYENLKSRWTHLSAVDMDSMTNVKPQLLIGQDHCHLIIPREVIEGPPNAPVLSKSLLGWSIHGNVAALKDRIDEQVLLHTWESKDRELHELVKDSFRTDNFGVIPPRKPLRSKEEERAINLLENTTKRIDERWETGLLWRNDSPSLPNSYSMAIKRLLNVEKLMQKDPTLAHLYKEKINEYLAKGYARKVEDHSVNEKNSKIWYIPHFPVYNANKPGKIRLVFDAAAKSMGRSLNDELLAGPDLLKPLIGVLFKFRQREIGFGGDIQEMFHRILIRDEDVPAQRFLWRNGNQTMEPQVYEMKAMFFGSTSSPCSAQYVKNCNAKEFQTEFPEASKAIIERHYVDDYLDSAHTKEAASRLISEVIELHRRGGFVIRNWLCSSSTVLQRIPKELVALKKQTEIDETVERVLGMHWNADSDFFTFRTNFHKVPKEIMDSSKCPTKRQVLKVVMSLFDPLGILSNFTVAAKILLQDIWRSGIGWDDELSGENLKQWNQWINSLPEVTTIKIPRCYNYRMKSCIKVDLHVFCDASEKAFSAVGYFRCINSDPDETVVSFVMAKSRVAPLKPMSIPRLELQAAVLGTRMAKTIKENHDIKINEMHYWSDSKTVLCWLRSEARQYKQFVAFRIGEILESSDAINWHWVPTKLNPADDATRDFPKPSLSSTSRWLTGPEYLKLKPDEWPSETLNELRNECESELQYRNEVNLHISSPTYDGLPDISRFSSWTKLIRSTAYVLRFIYNCQSSKKKFGVLDVEELKTAERLWWLKVQKDFYPTEVQNLKLGKLIQKSSSIYTLSPQIDDKGVLRLTGRINRCDVVTSDFKNPVILHPQHRYTKLMIFHYHLIAKHTGMEMVTNEVRQKFWIPQLRAAVRSTWSSCQFCKNKRSKPQPQVMGLLPPARLNSYIRPFTSLGMDFFGPINIRCGKKKEKRYGVLFTCMSTRAIHLELASSLTADSCIMAILRMISRRGFPLEIFCDNGTNLKGAEKELKEAYKVLDTEKLQLFTSTKNIKWRFNPPGAPHMGGVWERLIRSVKTTMKNILKDHSPTEEVLKTVLTEAESIVNSRPLTFVSLDHEDAEALTPNHFLIGCSSPAIISQRPACEMATRKQWMASQMLVDHFWKRWIKEYLPTLTRRTKWFSGRKPISVGSIVIIVDPQLPRNCWPKGKVTETFPGADGEIRVVEVKTSFGSFRRPVTKICQLDVESVGDN